MTTAVTPTSSYPKHQADCRPGLSIVVPCFNEHEGLRRLGEKLSACEQRLSERYQVHVLLVDDASTDQTWEALHQFFGDRKNYRLVRHAANCGIAAAIMTGLRLARSEIVCSIDADCTYDPLQIEAMLQQFVDGVDIVTASPYHPAGRTVHLVAWRLALSRLASVLYRQLIGVPLHTYTSCFRLYRRDTVAPVPLRNSGFVGVPELLWRVRRRGGRIVECPATLTARVQGQSKMRLVSVSLGHVVLMCRILWEQVFAVDCPTENRALAALAAEVPPRRPETQSRLLGI